MKNQIEKHKIKQNYELKEQVSWLLNKHRKSEAPSRCICIFVRDP